MRINELSRKMEEPDFWDSPEKAGHQTRELNALKNTKQSFHDLETLYEDARTLLEMGYEEQDESLILEVMRNSELPHCCRENMTEMIRY